jgi:hypothetical protein
VNPLLAEQHAPTPAKLQALIGHELLHVALGHTRRHAQISAMDNLVFDCLINSIWSKAHPTPEATALFRDFYREDVFPQCFLRPPDDWHPTERIRLPAALREASFDGIVFVKDVYRRLWGYSGASAWEIREAIRLGMKGLWLEVDATLVLLPLLGGHDTRHAQGITDLAPLKGFVRGLATEYALKLNGMPIEPGCKAEEVLLPAQLAPQKVSVRAQLRRLFAYLAHGEGSARIPTATGRPVLVLGPVPTRDRRAIVQRLIGATPLLYQSESVARRKRPSERVHVYLDVSGSMNHVIKALYGAMIDCADWVAPQVHLFSTRVDDISLQELRSGKVATNAGTCIECVAKHIQTNQVARALILTDGLVPTPSMACARTLSKTRLAVGWMGTTVSDQELGRFAGRQTHLSLL